MRGVRRDVAALVSISSFNRCAPSRLFRLDDALHNKYKKKLRSWRDDAIVLIIILYPLV